MRANKNDHKMLQAAHLYKQSIKIGRAATDLACCLEQPGRRRRRILPRYVLSGPGTLRGTLPLSFSPRYALLLSTRIASPCSLLYTFKTTTTKMEHRPRQFFLSEGNNHQKKFWKYLGCFFHFFFLTKESDTDKSCFLPIVLLCNSIFSCFYV